MLKAALIQFPAPWLMGCALGLFLFAMMVILMKTFNRHQREAQSRMAHLPLSED